MPQIFRAFSRCIIFLVKSYCVSFKFFYPLTTLIVLPQKKNRIRNHQLFQQAQSNGTNVGFMSQQLGHISNESICKIPVDLQRQVVPDPDFI